MLRHLGKLREDGTPRTRAGESDPADSVFVVLLADTVHDARAWKVGSVWLTLGEAQGAAARYVAEGHRAYEFEFALVMEYQTGQLAPDAERHGSEMPRRRTVEPETPADEIAALELRLAQLRAGKGQRQTVGAE